MKLFNLFTKKLTDREIAMKWWNDQSVENKQAFCWFFFDRRVHTSLTGREIQEMYAKIK